MKSTISVILVMFCFASCKGIPKRAHHEVTKIYFCSDPKSDKCIKMVGYNLTDSKKACSKFDSQWIVSEHCDESIEITMECSKGVKRVLFIDFDQEKHNSAELCKSFNLN